MASGVESNERHERRSEARDSAARATRVAAKVSWNARNRGLIPTRSRARTTSRASSPTPTAWEVGTGPSGSVPRRASSRSAIGPACPDCNVVLITVEASDDVSGSNVTGIPFKYREILTGDTPGALTVATTSGFTTTAGSSKLIVVEVDTDELGDTGYDYCRLKAVESVDSPVLGGILAIGSGSRFKEAIQETAIV